MSVVSEVKTKEGDTVLILIILEVLYEFLNTMTIEEVKQCLNPYYTGSTL